MHSSSSPTTYLRSQLTNLETDLDHSVHTIITALRDRVIELEAQQLNSTFEVQKLSRVSTQKEIILQETTKKIVELEKERRRSESQFSQVRERTHQELAERDHRILHLEEKLRNAEAAAASLEQTLKTREGIAEEAQSAARTATERGQAVATLTATLESRQAKLHKLARAVKSLKISLRTEKEASGQRERALEDQRDRVNQRYIRACEKVASLEGTVQDRDTVIAQRERAIQEANTRITAFQTQLQQNEVCMTDLKKAFTEAVGTLAERKRAIKDLQRQLEESARRLAEKDVVVAEANKLASERADQVTDISKRLAEVELANGEFMDKNVALEHEVENLKDAIREVAKDGNVESQAEVIRDASQVADAVAQGEDQQESQPIANRATPSRQPTERDILPLSQSRPQSPNWWTETKPVQSPSSATTAVGLSPSRSSRAASPSGPDQTDYIVKSSDMNEIAESVDSAKVDQVRNLERKYAELETRSNAQIALKTSEVNALEARVKELKKELSDALKKVALSSSESRGSIEQRNVPLQAEVATPSAPAVNVAKTDAAADDDRHMLQEIVKSLESALRVAQAEIQAMNAEHAEVIADADKELGDYRRKCEEYKNVCDEYKKVCEELNGRVADLEQALAKERASLGSGGDRASSRSNSTTSTSAAAMQLQTDQLKRAKLRIVELEKALSDLSRDDATKKILVKSDELEKKISELQTKLREAAETVSRRDKALQELTETAELRLKEVAAITARLAYAEEVIQDREAAIDERDKVLSELNSRIESGGGDASTELATAKRLAELENAIAERDSKLADLSRRLSETDHFQGQDSQISNVNLEAAIGETQKILVELARAKQEASTEVAKIKAEASKLSLERDRKISALERNVNSLERDSNERERELGEQMRISADNKKLEAIRNETVGAMSRRIVDISRVLAGQELPTPLTPTNPAQWQAISSTSPELAKLVSGVVELENTLQATADANRSGMHAREGSQGSITSIQVGPDGAPVKKRRPSFFKKLSSAFKKKEGETGE
ncbi:hypothetical protein HDU93_006258 [Gonapodya sp. JEL0774]|nr:hypothetical protein HDU93_006258 [Gonapodya sp. JEL0774]